MFCSECESKNKESAKYCHSCGNSLSKEKPSTSPSKAIEQFKISNLFKGRIERRHWWIGLLTLLTVHFGFIFLFITFPTDSAGDTLSTLFLIVFFALLAAILVFAFSLHVRRLHDLNYSGWTCLLFLVPIINLILFVALGFASSKDQNNEYGEKPDPDVDLLDTLLGKR